jgi:hypothetical protein
MTYTAPSVQYCATLDGTYTVLSGVQSVNINRGRKIATDPFVGSSCVIEVIPPATFTVELAVGQFLDVRESNSGTADAYFCGRITDIVRTYEIPYDPITGAAPGDRILITCSGPTGQLAATQLVDYVVTGVAGGQQRSTVQLSNILIDNGFTSVNTNVRDKTPQTFTYSGGAFDLFNQIARNVQAYIDDLDMQRTTFGGFSSAIGFFAPNYQVSTTVTDVFPGNTGTHFVGLQFLSSTQQSFNEIIVTASGRTTQVVETVSGPYNSLNYSTTLDQEADMLDLAQYLFAFNQETTAVPASVTLSSTENTQISRFAEIKTRTTTSNNFLMLGSRVNINFRGQTYVGQLQGIQTNYGIEQARQTLYFSANLGQPFTLNTAEFGVLDTSRLGYV